MAIEVIEETTNRKAWKRLRFKQDLKRAYEVTNEEQNHMIVTHIKEFNQYIVNSIYFDLRIQRNI